MKIVRKFDEMYDKVKNALEHLNKYYELSSLGSKDENSGAQIVIVGQNGCNADGSGGNINNDPKM